VRAFALLREILYAEFSLHIHGAVLKKASL
jgi:hypothetical protein